MKEFNQFMSNIFIKDNQVRALVSYLKPWDKNPRSIKEDNFTQLCTDVKKEQFKPLLILDDGTVLGGNMRIRAYQHNGQADVWVSVITLREDGELVTAFVNGHEDQTFQSKLDAMLHYSTIDNSPYGYNEKEKMAELFTLSTLPVENYFSSFDEPLPISSLLKELGPDENEQEIKEPKQITCPECGYVLEK